MTISKFLMTVAVCAVSISGITTSHGSNGLSADDHKTPTRSTEALQGSVSSWSGVPRGNSHDEDVESVSARSTTSITGRDPMQTLIEMLRDVPESVTFPGNESGNTPTHVMKSKENVVKYAVGNLIKAYTRLVVDYNRKTNELIAAQDTITELNRQIEETENNAVNPVETTPAVGDNQTPENNQSSPVETPSDVNNSSQWIAVVVGVVLGAGIVPLGNFIVEGYLSIAASFWGR